MVTKFQICDFGIHVVSETVFNTIPNNPLNKQTNKNPKQPKAIKVHEEELIGRF